MKVFIKYSLLSVFKEGSARCCQCELEKKELQTNYFLAEFIDIDQIIGSTEPPLQKFSTLLLTFHASQLLLMQAWRKGRRVLSSHCYSCAYTGTLVTTPETWSSQILVFGIILCFRMWIPKLGNVNIQSWV